MFPAAADYLSVYEKYDLIGRRAVLAHNVHASLEEMVRIASHQASVAHCPCSNAALGSGIFSMRRHLDAGTRFSLGTDIGAGIGFGILKEALQAYLMQRVAAEAMILSPAQMLWLATRAGAEALGIEDETGDFTVGKAADLVFFRPPAGSPLHAVLAAMEDPERVLTALLTLAEPHCISEVRVEGDSVFEGIQ